MRRASEVLASAILIVGCGGGWLGGGSYAFLDGRPDHPAPDNRSVRVRWRVEIAPGFRAMLSGNYVPVERASAALDPDHDRVYVGSSAGQLWALTGTGARVYIYDAGSAIGAAPTLDRAQDELYVPTEDGVLHLLTASTGALRWRCEIGGAVTQPAVLVGDAVYVVTDNDLVVAVARETGETLWRYRRDAPEGFYVAEHAGLALTPSGKLLTGFTDGVVVSLDPADGRLNWERDTTLDLESTSDGTPRFADVDTTPVVVGDLAYAASFAGGLYALEVESGTVRWVDSELTSVVGIASAPDDVLVLSSAESGLMAIDRNDRHVLWRKTPPRGSPTLPVVIGDLVVYGETQGGFVTASLTTGRELGRVETGHGFSAPASIAGGRGFILSNGGVLVAFALPGAS